MNSPQACGGGGTHNFWLLKQFCHLNSCDFKETQPSALNTGCKHRSAYMDACWKVEAAAFHVNNLEEDAGWSMGMEAEPADF